MANASRSKRDHLAVLGASHLCSASATQAALIVRCHTINAWSASSPPSRVTSSAQTFSQRCHLPCSLPTATARSITDHVSLPRTIAHLVYCSPGSPSNGISSPPRRSASGALPHSPPWHKHPHPTKPRQAASPPPNALPLLHCIEHVRLLTSAMMRPPLERRYAPSSASTCSMKPLSSCLPCIAVTLMHSPSILLRSTRSTRSARAAAPLIPSLSSNCICFLSYSTAMLFLHLPSTLSPDMNFILYPCCCTHRARKRFCRTPPTPSSSSAQAAGRSSRNRPAKNASFFNAMPEK